MVESDRAAYAALERNKDALSAQQVELARTDALEFLRRDRAEYDVVFVDPPFSAGYGDRLLPLLPARLARGGSVYYESADGVQWPSGWVVQKEGRAGHVVFQLVKRT
jgi:16S rRNA (guanine966-N2)-methyltransferase